MLAERRRADEAERDAKDERRLRSLAAATATTSGARTTTRDNDNGDNDGDDAAALRRRLKLATSEIEALHTHTTDLRNQIQSGLWSWLPAASLTATDVDGDEPASGGGGAGEAGVLDGAYGAKAALLGEVGALTAAGVGVGVGGGCGGCGGGGGRDDGGASVELDRLTSLLAERDAQIGVLASTVEALQTSPVLQHSSSPSPRKSGAAAAASTAAGTGDHGRHNVTTGGSVSSPRLHASSRENSRQATTTTATTSTAVSPGPFWADVFGDMMETGGGGGGVGVLNHVGAQGLARRCVALTVRLTSAIAREGKAERRADRLAAEAARREKRIAAAAAAEARLARRNRALDTGGKKAATALNGLRAETAARLREAGEEASKLR